MLNITIEALGDRKVIRCSGRLVHESVTVLLAVVSPFQQTLIDCGAVSGVDAAGIGALVALHGNAECMGGSVTYCNVTERIRMLLDITGISAVLNVTSETVEQTATAA